LSANTNIEALREQIDEFKPLVVSVMDEEKAKELKEKVDIPVFRGIDGLIKIATLEKADTVINALVGSIGILPTIEAIRKKKDIALANKETLVAAGLIVMREAAENGIKIMPIDSEHSAIFQCLDGRDPKTADKLILTCSGGAFRNLAGSELENVKAKNALNHPTWKMGAKITIDCATLMNKGFEVIEAHWLFSMPYEKIEVVIHPQSMIHSLVEFIDGSVIAQLGAPDMKIPIQYALTYPERLEGNSDKLNLTKVKELTFREPNFELFPCLKLAYGAGRISGTMPAVLNAANEIAVEYFLQDKIKFNDISKIIKKMMDEHKVINNPSLDEILNIDKEVKEKTRSEIAHLFSSN
jgi:1-deoxy-D-xylulose-5-phosphate reductoisomerase